MDADIRKPPTVEELEQIAVDNRHILRLIQQRNQWQKEIHDCLLSDGELQFARQQITSINNELSTIKGRK